MAADVGPQNSGGSKQLERSASDTAYEVHFKEVFDEFVITRGQCGESGELAFPKFAKRLMQTREAVIQKNGCNDVRFVVYVKNGKAALKAIPSR